MRPKNFEELLQTAKKQPDLMGALSSIGVELKRIGHSRRGEQYKVSTAKGISDDFSSIIFCQNYDGTWVAIDNKERTGKKYLDAITVLTELYEMDFDSAVYALTGTAPVEERSTYRPSVKPSISPPTHPVQVPVEPFILPEKRPQSSWKGIRYLTKDRLIPEGVARNFFNLGLIYMPTIISEKKKKPFDCVGFVVLDENKLPVGCEADATFILPGKHRFKMIVENSDQRYGFSFKNNVSEITAYTPIYFCESAVDAISLFCLTNYPGVYVSMSGLKDSLLLHTVERIGGLPVICTDNDDGGNRFRKKFSTYDTMIPEYGKDWNEELQYRVVNGMDYALKEESTLTFRDIQDFLKKKQEMKESAELGEKGPKGSMV